MLVLPGFMTGDGSTVALRAFLSSRGHRAAGWGLGRNLGNVGKLAPRVAELIARHSEEAGAPLHLVGWSLGGVLAREATRLLPEAVAQIITMGTPVVGGPKYTATADRYRARGVDLDALERQVAERNADPLPVPITALYSRKDAVVAWQACLDPNPDNDVDHVEVQARHMEMGFSAEVLRAVADRIETLRRRSGGR